MAMQLIEKGKKDRAICRECSALHDERKCPKVLARRRRFARTLEMARDYREMVKEARSRGQKVV